MIPTTIDIKKIKPASYNPRKIDQSKLKELEESISKLGFCIPILVNKKNNTIIAGHQRTKTALKMGITQVPCFFIEDITISDEIKFNQIHNFTDEGKFGEGKIVKTFEKGFSEIDNNFFEVKDVSASFVKTICRLIIKYGNVLCCVVSNNEIICGKEYVKACKLLNYKVNTCVIPKENYRLAKQFFTKQYGEYCYDNLQKNTWVQGLAQKHRLREENRKGKSNLYEHMVIPYLKNNKKDVLDFGCGKGLYIKLIEKMFNVQGIGVEFYNNNGSQINVEKGQQQINNLIKYLNKKGLFDVVVCDSVINSTDSMKAEYCVLGTLNCFCKLGGTLFISGRPISDIHEKFKRKTDSNKNNTYFFLDKDNFTSIFRKGQWFYQHFHSKESVFKELLDNGFEIEEYFCGCSSFRIKCKKVKELPLDKKIDSLKYEFDLPLPNNKSYKRYDDVFNCLKKNNLF